MTSDKPLVLLVSDNVWALHAERIRRIAPGVVPVIYEGDEPIDPSRLADVEVCFLSADTWPERIRGISVSIMKSPSLAWLQTFSAGVDSPFFVELMNRGVTLTNASGASSTPIAHTVMLYILALSRDVRSWNRKQDRREWDPQPLVEIEGSHLAVIGMGPIGLEIARLGAAFGMHVEAVRRTPTGSEPCATFGFDALTDVLGRADWVALALPLTDDTRHLFDANMIARIKPGARFINVGRGELVDESALVDSLRSGHLAGAALDVFEVEPLPVESPLWAMDNVIITPHNSGTTGSSGARSAEIFLDNLARYVAGDVLRNRVDH